jgi:hypothetical protein
MRCQQITMSATRLAAIAALAATGLALTACGGSLPEVPATAPGQSSATAHEQSSATAPGQASDAGGQHQPADRRLAGLHACALVSPATVAATVGRLEEPPTESSDGLTCFYNTRASSESGGPSFILNITSRSAYEFARSLADGEAQARLVRLAPVRGIGDEGYATAVSANEPDYNVTVAKGGAAAAVQVNSVDPADERQAERLLAAAVARL